MPKPPVSARGQKHFRGIHVRAVAVLRIASIGSHAHSGSGGTLGLRRQECRRSLSRGGPATACVAGFAGCGICSRGDVVGFDRGGVGSRADAVGFASDGAGSSAGSLCFATDRSGSTAGCRSFSSDAARSTADAVRSRADGVGMAADGVGFAARAKLTFGDRDLSVEGCGVEARHLGVIRSGVGRYG